MDLIIIAIAGLLIYLLSKKFYDNQSTNPNGADVNRNFSSNQNQVVAKNREEKKDEEYFPTTTEVGLIVALMSKIAKADGKICELEHELIVNSFDEFSAFFKDKDDVQKILHEIYEKESKVLDNIEDLAHQFFTLTTFDYKKRLNVVSFLVNLSFIDGNLSSNEEEILKKIVKTFRISQLDYMNLINSFRNFYKEVDNFEELSIDKASEILNLREKDTIEDVKKKYKALVKENHPDIIIGKGLEGHFVKEATEKLQLINEAYEVIKKAHKKSLELVEDKDK